VPSDPNDANKGTAPGVADVRAAGSARGEYGGNGAENRLISTNQKRDFKLLTTTCQVKKGKQPLSRLSYRWTRQQRCEWCRGDIIHRSQFSLISRLQIQFGALQLSVQICEFKNNKNSLDQNIIT
jgi:hypothetical protein